MMQKKLQKNYNQFFRKKLENKTIAVTGSKGFISKHLIKELKYLKIKKLNIKEINSNNTSVSLEDFQLILNDFSISFFKIL